MDPLVQCGTGLCPRRLHSRTPSSGASEIKRFTRGQKLENAAISCAFVPFDVHDSAAALTSGWTRTML